jgi:hypothetical protein
MCDGEKDLTYFGREPRTDRLHPSAHYYPLSGRGACTFHPAEGFPTWPIFHTLRVKQPRFGPYDQTAWKLTGKTGVVDGRRVPILVNLHPAAVGEDYRIWVDPERDFCAIRREIVRGDRILSLFNIKYVQDVSGIWVPSTWTMTWHIEDDPQHLRLGESSVCTVHEYELNPTIDPSTFQFEPPPGTEIQDGTGATGHKMSLVTASGKREVQDQELERGARYSDLLSTPPGQALLSPDQNGFGLTWLALAALLALVGWLALRRR